MSGVSPSSDGSGGYNYYTKQLNELQNELELEHKRSQEREAAHARDTEDNYKRNLEMRDRQLEETVNQVKQAANEQVERERAYSRAEVDKVKHETYDRFGKSKGLEADTIKSQLDDYRRGSELAHADDVRAIAAEKERSSRKISENENTHQEQLEKTARAARDSARELYDTTVADQKSQYKEYKADAEKRYDVLNRERLEEINKERNQAKQAVAEAQADFDRRIRKERYANAERGETRLRAYDDELNERVKQVNESHATEGRQLREQIHEVMAQEKNYIKEKGEGKREAIEEYENEWRQRERLNAENHAIVIRNLKEKAKVNDQYYDAANKRNLRDKELYFTEMIRKQNMDNHRRQADIEATFNKDRDLLEARTKKDRDQARVILERQLRDANEERGKSLENQAKAYQDTISRERESADTKIKMLERERQQKATSTDSNDISPAAEEAIRKRIAKEYQKEFEAEHERSKLSEDSIQRDYSKRLADRDYEAHRVETDIQSQNTAERHLERVQFLGHIRDTEFMKDITLRNREMDHDKQTAQLNKNYAGLLERQRREQEEIILAQKADSNAKIQGIRQDASFNNQMLQRAFTAKQNEIIRDYERKLADQKAEQTAQIEEIKAQTNQALRESERRGRQALEEQGRSYEQRLVQAELQLKERERYLTQSFQDEMDKVKRSNALLIQKKS